VIDFLIASKRKLKNSITASLLDIQDQAGISLNVSLVLTGSRWQLDPKILEGLFSVLWSR